jgi:hypothetical protein
MRNIVAPNRRIPSDRCGNGNRNQVGPELATCGCAELIMEKKAVSV